MSYEAWGDPPDDPEWKDYEYCTDEQRNTPGFFCEECKNEGGKFISIEDDYDYF